MAEPNEMEELYQKVVTNPQARAQMYEYHLAKGRFGNQIGYQAITNFENIMRDPNSDEARVLVNSFIPEYDRTITKAKKNKYMNGKITAAKGIIATGLLGIVLSFGIDKDAPKQFIRNVSLAGVLASIVGGSIVYGRKEDLNANERRQ